MGDMPNVKMYVDDICVCSMTMREHLGHLESGFERLRRVGLKVKFSKC